MSPPRIDHLGIITRDLGAAIALFTRLFGEAPAMIKEMPEEGLRIACFEAANITIEFIQYMQDGPSRAKDVMGEGPGLNHLSVQVADMAASLGQLEAAGFKVMDGFPRQGVHGPVAFFEPDETTGLLIETCQR